MSAIVNNTIVKNMTTATAVTSNGQPAPAGVSTGANSALLQATLHVAGSPTFSNPLDVQRHLLGQPRRHAPGRDRHRASASPATPARSSTGTSAPPMASGPLAPTNSMLQQTPAAPYGGRDQPDGVTRSFVDAVRHLGRVPAVARRTRTSSGRSWSATDVPPTLMGDYHLTSAGASARPSTTALPARRCRATSSRHRAPAPSTDIDGSRPAQGGFDLGADEIPPPLANLSISKTDGVSFVQPGGSLTYTIVVANAGPSAVSGAPVTDTFPAALTVIAGPASRSPARAARPPGRATPGPGR